MAVVFPFVLEPATEYMNLFKIVTIYSHLAHRIFNCTQPEFFFPSPLLLLIKIHQCFLEARCQIFLLLFRASFVLASFSSTKSQAGATAVAASGIPVFGAVRSLLKT